MDDESVGWPSAIVAIALLALVAAITMTAIIRYSVDDALKIWTALTAIVGVITGAFVSYFFSRATVKQAQKQAEEAEASANVQETALKRVAGHMESAEWQSILNEDPIVRRAFDTSPPDVLA